MRARRVEPAGPRVVEQRLEERGADAAAARLREDERRDVRVPQVGARDEPRSGEAAVELGDEVEPLRLAREPLAHLHDLRRALVRLDGEPHGAAGLEVGVRLRAAKLDAHPDRFSFPCRFAYRSPVRKTSSPSGIETPPIRSNGHTSAHSSPAPCRICSRFPRSA